MGFVGSPWVRKPIQVDATGQHSNGYVAQNVNMTGLLGALLSGMDGIPASGQLTFLTNDLVSQGYLDMTTFHQPSLTPGPKTQEGMCGLN
jgi:hypothetical protein